MLCPGLDTRGHISLVSEESQMTRAGTCHLLFLVPSAQGSQLWPHHPLTQQSPSPSLHPDILRQRDLTPCHCNVKELRVSFAWMGPPSLRGWKGEGTDYGMSAQLFSHRRQDQWWSRPWPSPLSSSPSSFTAQVTRCGDKGSGPGITCVTWFFITFSLSLPFQGPGPSLCWLSRPQCLGPWARRSPSPALEVPTTSVLLVWTGTSSFQERPLNSSSMIVAIDPQGSLTDFLAPRLATQAPWPSLGSRLRTRLIITASLLTLLKVLTQCSRPVGKWDKNLLSSQQWDFPSIPDFLAIWAAAFLI